MKGILYFKMLCMVLITLCIVSCSENDDNSDSSGISNQTWSANQTLTIPKDNKLVVSFTANGNWTAISGASWCRINPASGEAGKNTMEISTFGSTTVTRTANIIVRVDGSKTSSSFNVKQSAGDDDGSDDTSINARVDSYLKEKYLWNDEYKTLTPNFNLPYDKFLSQTLKSMTTNTLDYKPYVVNGRTEYRLFSYIIKKNNISSTRSTTQVPKEKEYNFGITGIIVVSTTQGNIFFEIQGVYKESSAAKQGLKRGDRIYYINNEKITESNYSEKGYTLIAPSSSISLQVAGEDKKAVTISSAPIFANPVILSKVIEKGNNKIGYLVYSVFDAGFDEELFDVFKEFKSQGITDLILDLRYNGGGHVMSADLISSCVAGMACKDKIFVQYRYNAERMKKLSTDYDAQAFSYDSYENLNKTSLSAGGLNLKRLYCLVGGNTASASELVVNSLRGIDIPVILIGETTHGKNVGMEIVDIKDNGDTYELAPITFQSYNAKNFGAYEKGFAPDYEIDEGDVNGDGYFDGYVEYGTDREPLFSKAISLITGEEYTASKVQRTRSVAVTKTLSIPYVKRAGMIKLTESK